MAEYVRSVQEDYHMVIASCHSNSMSDQLYIYIRAQSHGSKREKLGLHVKYVGITKHYYDTYR